MNDRTKNEREQLRWACRRGMLELDLLLGRFLDGHYLALTLAEQQLFKELLGCMDQDLFAWLLESRQPSDCKFLPLLKKIQAYARTGTSAQTV